MIISIIATASSSCAAGLRKTAPSATVEHPVIGSRADMQTRTGVYQGFRVLIECERPNCVSISGLGSQHYPGMDFRSTSKDLDFHGAIDRFRSDVTSHIKSPVHGSMFGKVCGDWELVLEILDWHEVDPSVAEIGDFLARDCLSDAVALCVTPVGAWKDI